MVTDGDGHWGWRLCRARITPSGSMAFHTLYGSRSGPGAELDGSRFSCDFTSPGEMGIASHSAFDPGSPRQSGNQSGGLSTSTSDREDSLLKKVWRSEAGMLHRRSFSPSSISLAHHFRLRRNDRCTRCTSI